MACLAVLTVAVVYQPTTERSSRLNRCSSSSRCRSSSGSQSSNGLRHKRVPMAMILNRHRATVTARRDSDKVAVQSDSYSDSYSKAVTE